MKRLQLAEPVRDRFQDKPTMVSDCSCVGTLWDEIYDSVYFSATTWRTIDKGLTRLAEAFHPVVDDKITYGRRINKLSYDEESKKTSIHWYDAETSTFESKTYDKTVVAVPFSVARLWRLPEMNPIMTEAITGLGYSYACKVAVSDGYISQVSRILR